jgi:hypothetical protein
MAIEFSSFGNNKNYGEPYNFTDIFYSFKLMCNIVKIVKVGCIVGLFVNNREYCFYFKLRLGSRAKGPVGLCLLNFTAHYIECLDTCMKY